MSKIGEKPLLKRIERIIRLSSMRHIKYLLLLPLLCCALLNAELLIPMDATQSNHLKAYGVAFAALKEQAVVKWLLNYRGGSFLLPEAEALAALCNIRGVRFEVVSSAQVASILTEIQ